MQATLDAFSLKSFTRALSCLSRYGDELCIYASRDSLCFSATNSSKSAYCRFKFKRQFFVKYNVTGAQAEEVEEALTVTGQLLTKSLLSMLRHRTVEKTVERCELSIMEGAQPTDSQEADEDQDGLESRLIVRLYCKHGVIKTHRLLLLSSVSPMVPGLPDTANQSSFTIGPKAIKDMLEHFPLSKGLKSDPQLIWDFGESEVALKSQEYSSDNKGKSQLSTELSISVDEFDSYNIFSPPISLAFHLREFNATITYADSMSLPLDFRFTDPAAPLFIDVEGDHSEILFVVSTSQVPGTIVIPPRATPPNLRKHDREETPGSTTKKQKPMMVAPRIDPAPPHHLSSQAPGVTPTPESHPPRLYLTPPAQQAAMPPPPSRHTRPSTPREPLFLPSLSQLSATSAPIPEVRLPDGRKGEPLFLPTSSQLSVADTDILRNSGLEIDTMDTEEFEAMVKGDGEEVTFDFTSQNNQHRSSSSFELLDDVELEPTQTSKSSSTKSFLPLFED
ncbi:Rad9-domain-containing protein [Infundibulicybe gibba]|nr:Rad9-domain-containing protein [Infundibulicybe gibba]